MNEHLVTAGPDSSPIANLQQVAVRIDSIVFATFFLAISMPFSRIVFLPTGFMKITGFDVIYSLVTCLLLLKIILLGKIRFAGMATFFSLTVAVYMVGSVALGDATLRDAIIQAHFYWPFAIAVMLLVVGTNADLHKFFRYTAGATIISAGSAFLLHYLFTAYVERLYEGTSSDVLAIDTGRMRWDNDPSTYFLFLYFMVRDKHSRINRLLGGSALLLAAAADFNTQSRTSVAGMVVFIAGSMFIGSGYREVKRRVGQAFGVFLLFATTIGALMVADSGTRALAYSRFLGGGGGVQRIFVMDLVFGRMELYRQYWTSITEHFPWGQGLGLPYSAVQQRQVTVTDISFMAFLLPLGILGLAIFGLFIRALWRTASQTSGKLPSKYSGAIKLLIVVSLAVSLNVDIYSRSNFVVLLTLLVLCCRNESPSHVLQHMSISESHPF